MSSLEVVFHIPQYIQDGLLSGAFQRVGGVIVETTSRQVVAWLRDSIALDNPLQAGGSLAGNLLPSHQILNLARIATTLIDGKHTRDPIALLYQPIEALQQTAEHLTLLTRFTATGQMVNLSLAAASFPAIIRRLDRLEQQIAELKEVILAEFERERDNSFKTALQAARDAFDSQESDVRKGAARHAIDGLFSARENFLTYFHNKLSEEPTEERLRIAQHYLTQAMYAEISRVRCYLQMDNPGLAKKRLTEDLSKFEEAVQLLIKRWLGNHPAEFLHKSVQAADVNRFLHIQRWLRDPHNSSSTDVFRDMLEIIDDLRQDFWNNEVLEDVYSGDIIRHITRRPVETFEDRLTKFPSRLTQMEILIENYQRLLGFELELRSMRLSFDEWSHLTNQDDIRKHGIGIIVDKDALDHLSRLQAQQ